MHGDAKKYGRGLWSRSPIPRYFRIRVSGNRRIEADFTARIFVYKSIENYLAL